MGSPADWGALGDICCGEDEASGCWEQQLREEIAAALDQRMVGQTVRVCVQQVRAQNAAHLLDRLVLENVETGDKLALGLGRLGRRTVIRLTEADCEGRLLAVTSRCTEPSGGSRICLHLQSPELFGPFAERMPCLRRALQRELPPPAADEVLAFLDGTWVAAPAREVLVSADEENDVVEGLWPSMSWWPAMPSDWALVDA
jgi:hypothetical protein